MPRDFYRAVLRSVSNIFCGAQPLSHGTQGDKSHSITLNLTGQFKVIRISPATGPGHSKEDKY